MGVIIAMTTHPWRHSRHSSYNGRLQLGDSEIYCLKEKCVKEDGGYHWSPHFQVYIFLRVVWKQTFMEHTPQNETFNQQAIIEPGFLSSSAYVGMAAIGVFSCLTAEAWDAASDTNSEVPEETTDALLPRKLSVSIAFSVWCLVWW